MPTKHSKLPNLLEKLFNVTKVTKIENKTIDGILFEVYYNNIKRGISVTTIYILDKYRWSYIVDDAVYYSAEERFIKYCQNEVFKFDDEVYPRNQIIGFKKVKDYKVEGVFVRTYKRYTFCGYSWTDMISYEYDPQASTVLDDVKE